MGWSALCRVVSCCVVLADLATAPIAAACANGVEIEIDPRVEAVQVAESALLAGHLLAAAKLARQVDPKVRTSPHVPGLSSRAKRVMALVVVRSGGKWLVGGGLSVKSDDDRKANIAWAIRVLRERVMQQLNHPDRLADLGEALASVAEFQDEGRRILEYLADRDLMTSAHAWAALARLRTLAGDAVAADRALVKCRKHAKLATVCPIHERPAS